MATILHCADLHYSASEREYSASVLREIVELARDRGVEAILFCGDTFDSAKDLEACRQDFREALRAVGRDCAVVLLPGNHEALGAPGSDGAAAMARYDLAPATVASARPFSLIELASGAELLAIPFATSYPHMEWEAPRKRAGAFRIVMAHGTVPSLAFSLESGEGDDGALDPDLFARFGADYAALGHIHSGRDARYGDCVLAYPGSARVWRSGESGPRTAILVEEAPGAPHQRIELLQAGQERELELRALPGGELEADPNDLAAVRPRDAVRARISGYAESEAEAVAQARRALEGLKARSIDISSDGLCVSPLSGGNAFARAFLAEWERMRPPQGAREDETLAWRKSREIGLRAIYESSLSKGARQ
jgi:DNA repair protein SbcD/Mre11